MHPSFPTQRAALQPGNAESSREGRDCELSRRLTAMLLFPRLDVLPGAWFLLLAATCTYVAVRALELAAF